MKRATCLLWIYSLVLGWALRPVYAQEGKSELSLQISPGIGWVRDSGHDLKVGAYQPLESDALMGLAISGPWRGSYFDFVGHWRDRDDQRYELGLDLGRILREELSFNRFVHRSDNDPLVGRSAFTLRAENLDPRAQYEAVRSELRSRTTLVLPAFPQATFRLGLHAYTDRGEQQGRTMGRCNECHLKGKGERINRRMAELEAGLSLRWGPATLDYAHRWRDFEERSNSSLGEMVAAYRRFSLQGFSAHPPLGLPFALAPDSQRQEDRVRARLRLPGQTTLHASFLSASGENRYSGDEVTARNWIGRVSSAPFKGLRVAYRLQREERESDVRLSAFGRRVWSTGLEASYPLGRGNTLRGEYEWRQVDRDNFELRSSKQETLRFALLSQGYRQLRGHLRYQHRRERNPFTNLGAWRWGQRDDTGRPDQTNLPTDSDQVEAGLTWSPRANLSGSASYRWRGERNADAGNHLQGQENAVDLSLWMIPRAGWSLTAGYAFQRSDRRSDLLFGSRQEFFLPDQDVTYRSVSHSLYADLGMLLTSRLSLNAGLRFSDSRASFSALFPDLQELSDLKVSPLEASLRIGIQLTRRLGVSIDYVFEDYNDSEVGRNRGRAHAVYTRLHLRP
ncbi:MAG: MtrB/PioB family outer membrane beta-barrel protein [Candidatus Tectomicrobia bacterium]|uniref:MtrB/PioB family outer membrane beta-barrel protein n=1 Tax=Tectimicrobiota bacterium TaxID=2528274 RepID=A0A932CLE2_UNCTE|nr:MtrB/PioB family outer membrane beta-barrel protein [Candidatus Tectomicrobia bacterium]